MSQRRVVITGIGLCSPIGNSLDEVTEALVEMRSGVVTMPEFARVDQLDTRLGALVRGVDRKDFPRKKVRTMGRVAVLSAWSSDRAIEDAGLTTEYVQSGRVGLAHGSTHGSSSELERFVRKLFQNESLAGLPGSSYLAFMSHTTAANLAMYYGIRGRIITTCSACTSASQAIGSGYEAVKLGLEETMICGGAEEMHFSHPAVFDIMYATSTRYNSTPELSPRPFDAQRDGLVVGEGAGAVVLESYERAKARGAHIYAEILGYGTNCDGTHMVNPSWEGMAGSMQRSLADAGVPGDEIDYVNAHGTATELGDIAETRATHHVLGERVPISSTKSYTGHTLGACGAIEAIFCLGMLRDGFIPPTRNLDEVDERCAPLDYVRGAPRQQALRTIMSNNFAFGGINTSLVLRAV